jgi:hypothetical protein
LVPSLDESSAITCFDMRSSAEDTTDARLAMRLSRPKLSSG